MNLVCLAWASPNPVEFAEALIKFTSGMTFDAFKELCLDGDSSNTIIQKIKFLFAVIGMGVDNSLDIEGINPFDWEKIILNGT